MKRVAGWIGIAIVALAAAFVVARYAQYGMRIRASDVEPRPVHPGDLVVVTFALTNRTTTASSGAVVGSIDGVPMTGDGSDVIKDLAAGAQATGALHSEPLAEGAHALELRYVVAKVVPSGLVPGTTRTVYVTQAQFARRIVVEPLPPTQLPPPPTNLRFLEPPPNAKGCPGPIPAPRFVSDIDHPDTFDRLSCFMPRTNTEVWIIADPDVTQPSTDYRAITVRQGDRVIIAAGGCVQRGGQVALTTERYVEPRVTNWQLDDQHYGSIEIGGILAPTRLSDAVRRIPIDVVQPTDERSFVRLHYEDDNPRDNGYWSMDRGFVDQCREMERAWVVIVIEHGCAGRLNPNCPSAAPMDLVAQTTDENGLPLQPKWGWELLTGSAAPVDQVCNFSQKQVIPTEDPHLCTLQPTTFNNSTTKCPDADLGALVGTRGWIGGHINWRAATYFGRLVAWGGRDGWDDDYQMDIRTSPLAGVTEPSADHIEIEYDSDEVIDHVKSQWWKNLKNVVDGNVPGTAASSILVGPGAIVIGEMGIDCAHSCASELHPAYVLAMHLKTSTIDDDQWAFFARNWGNEGYCGPDDVPVVFPNNRVVINIHGPFASVPLKGADYTPELLDSTEYKFSHDASGMAFSFSARPNAANIAFTLLPPERQSMIDGIIHLRWSGTPPPWFGWFSSAAGPDK